MNAIDLLRIDHQRLFKLAEQLQDRPSSSAAERINEIALALKLHQRMEEEIFYQELKEFDEIRVPVEQSHRDHRMIDDLLDRLSQSLKEPSRYDSTALATRLALAVEQHISHDEEYLLPQAERLLSPTKLQEIFYEMDEVRTHQSDTDSLIYPASRLGPKRT